MKKLLSLLALAALLPVSANADVLQNVNLKGDIQTIASDVNHNNNVLPYNSGTSVRVLAGLSADLVEDVTANLTFQYANLWGQDDSAGKSVQNYWDTVRLVEANVVLHNLFCCLEATVGRQFYGDEDSAVMYFGPNHYNAEFNGYTNSLDAAKITYVDDFKAFTVIAGKINATTGAYGFTTLASIPVASPVLPDFDIFGADLKLNLTDTLKAQVYGYDVRDPDSAALGDKHQGFYGAKLTFNPEAFRLSAEYARNFAGDKLVREHNPTGHMVKVDVATDIKAVTARGAFLYANENFWAFGNYTPGLLIGHRLGGNIFDYSLTDGVTLFNLGFDVKPADKWTVSLDGYSFQDHRMKHSSTWEGDLTVKYAHNEYVELFAGAGYAKYTTWNGTVYNSDTYAKDNVKGQLGMLIKF
jgi:hypothetical protein